MATLEDESPVLITDSMIEDSLSINSFDVDEDYKEYVKSNACSLWLEYAKILKIDNLSKLTSLRKLYLDNNYIENISGLETLVHLQWLDLSFNRLREIKGLEILSNLEVLALNNNEIQEIKGLDAQKKLQVLRLSSNKLAHSKDVMYLRRIATLRTLSIRDNPFCKDRNDWKSFVIALLPQIVFIESEAISSNSRKEATSVHQGIILRTEGKEDRIATEKALADKEAKDFERDARAFVSAFRNNGLKKLITEGEDEREIFGDLEGNRNYLSLKAKFESDEDAIGLRIYQYGHQEQEYRDSELLDLEECLKNAETEYRNRGIMTVQSFMEERTRIQSEYLGIVNELGQGTGGEDEERALRREFDKMKDLSLGDLKAFKDRIMELEISLVNQTDKTIAFFEKTLLKNLDNFLSEIQSLFCEARNADTRFYRRTVELIESEVGEEDCKLCREVVGRCHDVRQSRLTGLEEELEASVRVFYREYVEELYENLQVRNRSRILELQHFVDRCKAETDEYDFIPSAAAVEDDEGF